jgi:hypothetical protein
MRDNSSCRRGRGRLRPFMLVVPAITLVIGSPADASLIINATFDNSIKGDPNAVAIEGVINSAIGFYQPTLTNPIASRSSSVR